MKRARPGEHERDRPELAQEGHVEVGAGGGEEDDVDDASPSARCTRMNLCPCFDMLRTMKPATMKVRSESNCR